MIIRVELLVLVEGGDVGSEEHLDFGSDRSASFSDDIPSLFEVVDGSLVGSILLVVVDLMSESKPDFDTHIGVLLHDFADSDGLLVVVVLQSPPSSNRHDRSYRRDQGVSHDEGVNRVVEKELTLEDTSLNNLILSPFELRTVEELTSVSLSVPTLSS